MTTREGVAAMLSGCPHTAAAHVAVLADARWHIGEGTVSARQLTRPLRRRHGLAQRRGQLTRGLVEAVRTLDQCGHKPVRVGLITAQAWTFVLVFDAAVSRVITCTGTAPP